MRNLSKIAAIAAAAALALASTACGTDGGGTAGGGSAAPVATPQDTSAPVTLTWWTGQNDEAQTILETLAAQYTSEHPNVKIDVQAGASSTEELLQKLSASFAADNYPDISYAFGSWASQLEASNRTLDLREFVKDPAVDWEGFPQAARQTAQPTGNKIIGFPAVVDNISLLYNKTVFDAAGVAYPTEQWSWDDFRAAAKQLTDPAKQTFGYAYSVSGSEETTWQFWPHLWQRGGDILSEDGKTATFNSQAGVDALTFLRGMAVDDKSLYLDQTDTKFGQLFCSDRIGMITSGPWQLTDLKQAGTKYGVVQLPGTNGSHQTVSGPDLWVLLNHNDANRTYWATQFIAWLTAPEQDAKWNIAYGNLPLRASETDTEAFKAQVQEMPGLDIMAANSVNATTARPTVPGYVGLSEAIAKAISNSLQGGADPKTVLDKAAQEAGEALAETA